MQRNLLEASDVVVFHLPRHEAAARAALVELNRMQVRGVRVRVHLVPGVQSVQGCQRLFQAPNAAPASPQTACDTVRRSPHHHASCRCFRTPCLALHEHSLGAAMGVPAVSGFTRGLPGKPSRSLPPALPLDTPARSTPRPPVFAPWARLVSVMKSTAGPRSRLSRRCPTAHRGRLWDSVPSVPPLRL